MLIAYIGCPPTSRWTTTKRAKPTFPCSARNATAFVKKWAGRLFMRSKRTVCPATRCGRKTVISSKSSRNVPNRASLTSCWYSCLTGSGALRTRRLSWWNGSSRTASGSGAPRRVNSGLTITPTSSPTTYGSGKLTVKVKRLQSAQKPPSAKSSRTAGSRAVSPHMAMILSRADVSTKRNTSFTI